jgi:NAD(P)-dependent dehydrogenase (short-subunit alcohol dehydrogenase family)
MEKEKEKDENFYKKKQLKNNLDKILSQITFFLKNCERFKLEESELNNLIYTHSIYKNRNRISEFLDKINNSEEKIRDKIIELQEESEMRQRKKNEVEDLKNILNVNMNNNLLTNESQDKSILLITEGLSEDKTENDILVEDSKDVENKELLKKKRTKDKDKEKEGENKGKYIYKTCYICKQKLGLDNISKFYGSLCTKCGDYNYSFRTMKLDFTGRIAIVTGGRIKIGFYIVKKLLSYGCKVITTSRFPKDALFKFKEDPEYDLWKNNLIIYPIDFRIIQSTMNFVKYIEKNFSHIDFLINNAAQTVRRTTEYYEYLMPIEVKKLPNDDNEKIIKNDYLLVQKQVSEEFEKDKLKKKSENENDNIFKFDIQKESEKKQIINSLVSLIKKNKEESDETIPLSVIASQIKIMEEKEQPKVAIMGGDGQPYDFSKGKNSWNFELDEIPLEEFIEVQIINAWTPYYLCVKLKPLMMQSPYPDKYIVNVTSVEGIFNHYKRSSHVHTNMAKAALNMFTRTCGSYLKDMGIYMTCVDTGWVSPMNEINKIMNVDTKDNFEQEFTNIPLDELDGAMRVLHPIIEGIKNKNYLYGILLKDYEKSDW